MNEQKANQDAGVYGSGLSIEDWTSLRDVVWPFLHTADPGSVEIPAVPQHLESHPVVQLMREYRESADEEVLDRAGRLLIPTETPFGWYLPLTK